MTAPRLAVLTHADFEGPGMIAECARERGAAVQVLALHRGDPLPDLDGLSALVTMGGPMGVNDIMDHPYLVPERGLLAEAAAAGVPVLGVCLGAQQLAEALGGRVYRGPEIEVGTGSVERTIDAEDDPLLGGAPAELPCFHWHRDTFELPPGAVRLACGDVYPNQAFRVGRAWGLQFHVEIDADLLRGWEPHLPAGVAVSDDEAAAVREVGRVIVGGFLDEAGVSA